MYDSLSTEITQYIYENTDGAITGTILQSVLTEIVSVMGTNSNFMGVATPSTTPASAPDGKQFYIAVATGTYSSTFGGVTLTTGDVYLFYYLGSGWSATNLMSSIKSWANARFMQPTNKVVIQTGGTVINMDYIKGSNAYYGSGSTIQNVAQDILDLGLFYAYCNVVVTLDGVGCFFHCLVSDEGTCTEPNNWIKMTITDN